MQKDTEQLELCMIDSGVRDMKCLQLPASLKYLNLHCNRISIIQNLVPLHQLKHLDLSSNEIAKISGLETCGCLETLNLACNIISKVEGIEEMRSLRKFNISYNRVADLSGFKSISRRTHKLSVVELYGNNITSVKEITQNMNQCTCVETLYLEKNGDTNPVCSLSSYKPNVLSQLPWLKNLDGRDRYGNILEESINSQDIPGLDEYLKLLEPSPTGSSDSQQVNKQLSSSVSSIGNNVITPKIDLALEKFYNRKKEDFEGKPNVAKVVAEHPFEEDDGLKERLQSLEKTFCDFVLLYQNNQKRDTLSTKENETTDKLDSSGDSTATITSTTNSKKQDLKSPKLAKKPFKRNTNLNKKTGVKQKPSLTVTGERTAIKSKSSVKLQSPDVALKHVRSPEDDETYLALMNELDCERERRWKSEQATRKLLDTIKTLQERLIEERKIQEAAISSSAKFKQALEKEMTARKNFEDRSNHLENENSNVQLSIEELAEANKNFKISLEDMQGNMDKLKQEKLRAEIHYTKQFQELDMKAGGSQRELELLQVTAKKQKEQILQLQDLLVSREQEHRVTLEKMVSVDGKEVRALIEKGITANEKKNKEILDQHIRRLNEKNKEYSDLEDEFRMALQIEANRYNELYKLYEESKDELNEIKSTFENTCQSEVKSRNLVRELSAMVKEQKTRISEISKNKQEMQSQYKERLKVLESEVTELRKASSKVESLQQDKERLAAHIRGQESVVQGLRAERKLWGQELAQQGASLAQERGRLDVQIESQKNEILSLTAKLQDSQDSLKIKCKLIDDQTHTIKTMKEDLREMHEKNESISKKEEEERQYLENEFEKVKDENGELQEMVESLKERKEELKSELAEMSEQLSNNKKELKSLKQKWNEKSILIDQFENKVIQMKSIHDEKEKVLNHEKEEALIKLKALEKELEESVLKFEREKSSERQNFELSMRKAKYQLEKEVEKANQKVLEVEEEMRLLLMEKAEQKKNLELRITKLSNAFAALRDNL